MEMNLKYLTLERVRIYKIYEKNIQKHNLNMD